jgi:hypothetical protein
VVSSVFQWCHWHRWTLDLILIAVSAMLLTPLKRFQQCHWHRWNGFSGQWHCWNFAKKIVVVEIPMIFFISQSWWFRRCHWYRWNCFSGVIDTAESGSAVSLTPLKQNPRCQWHRGNSYEDQVSVASLTPQKRFQRCHWHRWNANNVDYFGEYKAIYETALALESGP